SIDSAFQFAVEELLDAAKISKALLPHRTHKCNRAGCLNLSLVERPDYPQKYRETATIVADTWTFDDRAAASQPDSDLFAKHRIEMSTEDQVRPGRGPAPLAKHVARAVDADVLQSERLE